MMPTLKATQHQLAKFALNFTESNLNFPEIQVISSNCETCTPQKLQFPPVRHQLH